MVELLMVLRSHLKLSFLLFLKGTYYDKRFSKLISAKKQLEHRLSSLTHKQNPMLNYKTLLD